MKRIYFLLVLAALVSCSRNAGNTRPTIDLVRNIISDTDLPEHGMVAYYNAYNSGNSIYIVGSPDACARFRTEFGECDRFDNVDGRRIPDGLPDFAGEVICTIRDFANTPYRLLADSGRSEQLREVMVRNVLSTMNDVCYINRYDKTGTATKPLSKLVVMASPYACEFGRFDLDSLFSALDCDLKVVYPVKVMMDKVLDANKGNVVVGVIPDPETLSSKAHASYLYEQARARGLADSECIVLRSDTTSTEQLLSFLDNYLESGHSRPLNAILIGNKDVDTEVMRQTLKRITSANNEESLSYGRLIAPGCQILDVAETVSAECVRIMRERNLFSHRIAYPRFLEFQTVALADSSFVLCQYDNVNPFL